MATRISSPAQMDPEKAPLLDQGMRERLLGMTEITTMEKKYAWHPRIAEFWCAMTSPMFALPALLYYVHAGPQTDNLCSTIFPPMTHVAIALSVVAAIASTAYHTCPNRLLSTCDTCIAALAFYIHTMALLWVARHDRLQDEIWTSSIEASLWAWFIQSTTNWYRVAYELLANLSRQARGKNVFDAWQALFASAIVPIQGQRGLVAALHAKLAWPLSSLQQLNAHWAASVVSIMMVCLFLWQWESSAHLTILVMGAAAPIAVGVHVHLDEYLALVLGGMGVACFLLDRKGYAAVHSLWHIFVGLSLYFGLEETILVYREHRCGQT